MLTRATFLSRLGLGALASAFAEPVLAMGEPASGGWVDQDTPAEVNAGWVVESTSHTTIVLSRDGKWYDSAGQLIQTTFTR